MKPVAEWSPADQRKVLIQALVGPKHLYAYHNSPEFHASIHTLTAFLTTLVNGLAAEAREFAAAVGQVDLVASAEAERSGQ